MNLDMSVLLKGDKKFQTFKYHCNVRSNSEYNILYRIDIRIIYQEKEINTKTMVTLTKTLEY